MYSTAALATIPFFKPKQSKALWSCATGCETQTLSKMLHPMRSLMPVRTITEDVPLCLIVGLLVDLCLLTNGTCPHEG